MTPPDSDAEDPAMRYRHVGKPDSGVREVRLQMALAVFRDMADPQQGMAEADAETRAHWMQSGARLALIKCGGSGAPDFALLPLSLAQRILAALGGAAQWAQPDIARSLLALRDELRALVTK